MQLTIQSMTCGGCLRSVTKTIQSVDPAATVSGDPDRRTVEVTTTAPRAALVDALTKVGFPPA